MHAEPSETLQTNEEDALLLRLIQEGKVIPPRAPRRISYDGFTPLPARGPSIVEDVLAIRGADEER